MRLTSEIFKSKLDVPLKMQVWKKKMQVWKKKMQVWKIIFLFNLREF